MAIVSQPNTRLIRQARIAESLTVAWMVVELIVAIWAGVVARSVALTTFGIDSALELFTALVVLRQLCSTRSEQAMKSSMPANGRPRVSWALASTA